MTPPNPSPQKVTILSETPQQVFVPGQDPKIVIALTYQVNGGPPRTLWIDEDKLPDAVWRRQHPGVKEVPADLVRQGDEARKLAIRADIEKRKAAPERRTLEI